MTPQPAERGLGFQGPRDATRAAGKLFQDLAGFRRPNMFQNLNGT